MCALEVSKMILQAFYLALAATLASAQRAPEAANSTQDAGKVKVDVYYLTNCGAAKWFFQNDLTETVETLGDEIDLNLYPVAFANGGKCTERLCEMAHIHACAFNQLQNSREKVEVGSCLFDLRPSHFNADKKCLKSVGLSQEAVLKCAKGSKGTKLQAAIDKKASKFLEEHPAMKWSLPSPTIAINGDNGLYKDISKPFKPVLCEAIHKQTGVVPKQCEQDHQPHDGDEKPDEGEYDDEYQTEENDDEKEDYEDEDNYEGGEDEEEWR